MYKARGPSVRSVCAATAHGGPGGQHRMDTGPAPRAAYRFHDDRDSQAARCTRPWCWVMTRSSWRRREGVHMLATCASRYHQKSCAQFGVPGSRLGLRQLRLRGTSHPTRQSTSRNTQRYAIHTLKKTSVGPEYSTATPVWGTSSDVNDGKRAQESHGSGEGHAVDLGCVQARS